MVWKDLPIGESISRLGCDFEGAEALVGSGPGSRVGGVCIHELPDTGPWVGTWQIREGLGSSTTGPTDPCQRVILLGSDAKPSDAAP